MSGEELEGSLGKVSGGTVGLHSHHPLVVWTRSELVEGGKKPANQKRRITAGRERAVTETAVCPVPLAVPDSAGVVARRGDERRRRQQNAEYRGHRSVVRAGCEKSLELRPRIEPVRARRAGF